MISSVSMQSFMSYTDAVVPFTRGFNVIDGANGSGKTAVINAIGLALFGYTPYRLNSLIRYGEKTARVTVEFEGLDGNPYVVDRVLGSSPSLKALSFGKVQAQGKTDVSQFVASHFGLAPDVDLSDIARNGVISPQGGIITPFRLATSQRKAIFDGVLGIDRYERSFRDMAPPIRIIKAKGAEVAESIAGLKGQLRRLDDVHAQIDRARLGLDKIPRLEDIDVEMARLEKSIHKLAGTKETWLKKSQELKVLEHQLKTIGDAARDLPGLIELAEKRVKTCEEARRKIPALEKSLEEKDQLETAIRENHEQFSREAGVLQASMRVLREQEDALQAIESSTCPICNKPLDKTEREKLISDTARTISEISASLASLAEYYSKTKREIMAALARLGNLPQEIAAAQAQIRDETSHLSSLHDLRTRLEKAAAQRAGLKGQFKVLLEQVGEIKRVFAEEDLEGLEKEHLRLIGYRATCKADYENLVAQLSDLETEGLRLEAKLLLLEQQQDKSKQLSKAVDKAEKIRSAIRTAGPLVAARLVESIGTAASVLFSEMMSAHEVEASLEWTGDYGIITSVGRTRLDVRDDPVNGGKAQLAALAVRLALLQELSQVGFIILDEPTANLDGPAMDMLGHAIKEISSRFNQIVVISHDKAFAPYSDHSISLVNRGGETVVQ